MLPETGVDLSVLDQLPIASWSWPRILVGIPIERTLSYADHVFWPFMMIATQGPAFIASKYMRIDLARIEMAKELLLSTYTHLLMLDADHIHPVDIIQRLARWVIINPNIRVVSGMNFRRKPPYDPVMGNFTKTGARPIITEWNPGIFPIDEIGAASLLVHRSVFEEMEPPWFDNDYSRIWENNFPGEDISFCHHCRDHNIPVYVDTTTTSPHMCERPVTEETFREYLQNNPGRFNHVG
jgi:hypothetical protein